MPTLQPSTSATMISPSKPNNKTLQTMSNKKETPEQTITDISIYVAALFTTYRPASSPAEATHFFSTAEVVDAIRGIDPSAKISPEQVFSALIDAGFNFCNRPGAHSLEFKWMFRER